MTRYFLRVLSYGYLWPLLLSVLMITGCSPSAPDETDSTWFEFRPDEEYSEGVIDMQDWIARPAGRQGALRLDGDRFVFEDGTPVKFWGVNICSELPYSDSSTVEQWADYLIKYGVNAVRFHKFSKHGMSEDSSTILTPGKYQRLDYFHHELAEHGIYYGWSHIYGHKPRPADSSRLLNYSEIKNLEYPWSHLNGSTSSLVNFAEDLQDLSIELTVNMLNHVNPYTGKRYAEDPALIFVEFQNEDDIFWSAIGRALEQAPTYRALLCRKFSNWLQQKYGTQEKLVAAWGAEHLPEGETLKKQNIFPEPNHSLFQDAYQKAFKENREMPTHLVDKMAFLYEEQMAYYHRFEAAVRETGYQGPLVASCWQAGIGPAHYYNLHADAEIGIIDRHNYFAGGGGHRMKEGAFVNRAMVSFPGSGLLNTGMQQVENRPFAFSEWMSLIPNEWTAESSPIIALYGLGLQGWDASYAFASNVPRFTPTISSRRHNIYNVDVPTQIGLYPFLARAIYRGDIEEGAVVAERKVSIPRLKSKGEVGFYEHMEQGHDIKYLTGDVSPLNLAAGRVVVDFDTGFQQPVVTSSAEYIDTTEKIVTSSTEQLEWVYRDSGLIKIKSDGTKGIVGFPDPEATYELEGLKLKTANPFAVILLCAKNREADISSDSSVLVATVARAKNTGMQYNEDRTELLAVGEAPLLLEAVDVELTFEGRIPERVLVLDHMGRRTGKEISVDGSKVVLDGSRYQTLYYEIRF